MTLKNNLMNKVNIAVQILPKTKSNNDYDIIDKAIEVIKKSGVKYRICPFETVMEGEYDHLLSIVKEMQQACYDAGAYQVITNLKIQNAFDKDVTIDAKMKKYENE